MMDVVTFEVGRKDLGATHVTTERIDPKALAPSGQAVLEIERFALTANNITYGAYGDAMNYWAFFPSAAETRGRIPVWGFARVITSPSPDLPAGTRVYGYVPMSTHLVVTPGKINASRFIDVAQHRRALPPVYNVYQRVDADPDYRREYEPQQMLLRPLVITSFLIADFLDDNAMFGASRVLVSSASSKTSIGLGLCLQRLGRKRLTTVGLTSARNRDFTAATRAYDHVVTYDDIAGLDPSIKSVFVDMAGSTAIIRSVHDQLRDSLAYSCRVGATHWEDMAGRLELPGPKPVFFFAPTQVQKRQADWGPGGLEQRFASAWGDILARTNWLDVKETKGAAAVEAAYRATLAGNVPPSAGLILSL
jgi:hypothetical protein